MYPPRQNSGRRHPCSHFTDGEIEALAKIPTKLQPEALSNSGDLRVVKETVGGGKL